MAAFSPRGWRDLSASRRRGPRLVRSGGLLGGNGRREAGQVRCGLTGMCQGYAMRKYVIMGIQGSGKGTQSKLLAQDMDIVHISVGDIFRWHVTNHTQLGAQVERCLAAG